MSVSVNQIKNKERKNPWTGIQAHQRAAIAAAPRCTSLLLADGAMEGEKAGSAATRLQPARSAVVGHLFARSAP